MKKLSKLIKAFNRGNVSRKRLLYKQIYKITNFLLKRIENKNYYFLNPTSDWFLNFDQNIENINDTFHLARLKNLSEIIKLTRDLEGDYIELGVHKGESAKFICDFIEKNKKNTNFYGFDSFQGLPEPNSSFDGNYWRKGDFDISVEIAKNNLDKFSFVNLIEGFLPETLEDIEFNSVAFIHFDLDLYSSTISTLEYLYPKLIIGGIALFDDYGFSTSPGVTQAVNEFLDDKNEEIINLSAGGSFFIKTFLQK